MAAINFKKALLELLSRITADGVEIQKATQTINLLKLILDSGLSNGKISVATIETDKDIQKANKKIYLLKHIVKAGLGATPCKNRDPYIDNQIFAAITQMKFFTDAEISGNPDLLHLMCFLSRVNHDFEGKDSDWQSKCDRMNPHGRACLFNSKRKRNSQYDAELGIWFNKSKKSRTKRKSRKSRKSRKPRKSRKSRKSRKPRKSRKSRKSRKPRKSRKSRKSHRKKTKKEREHLARLVKKDDELDIHIPFLTDASFRRLVKSPKNCNECIKRVNKMFVSPPYRWSGKHACKKLFKSGMYKKHSGGKSKRRSKKS